MPTTWGQRPTEGRKTKEKGNCRACDLHTEEDEMHLFQCEAYDTERKKWGITGRTEQQIMAVLTNPTVPTIKYIADVMK